MSGGESKENVEQENVDPLPVTTLPELTKEQKKRRKARKKRAEKKLRERQQKAARNVRRMRSYGGGGGRRSIRFFSEIRNRKVIGQRRGEEALERKIRRLEDENNLLRRDNSIIFSIYFDEQEALEKPMDEPKNLNQLVLPDQKGFDSPPASPGGLSASPGGSRSPPGPYKTPWKLFNLTDSPYGQYK